MTCPANQIILFSAFGVVLKRNVDGISAHDDHRNGINSPAWWCPTQVLPPKKGAAKRHPEIDDKPPGSFRKKSARGCMFMGNKQITEIRFGKLGGSQSLFLSSRGARPFF